LIERASTQQYLDRAVEYALGLVKIVGKIGEGTIGFWSPTNSVLELLRPQTTVKSFVNSFSKLRSHRQTDRRQRS